jgi:putative ABC transport system substrate-binding protein
MSGLAPSHLVNAQPAGKVARLGILLFGTPTGDPNLRAFLEALRELGYVEGRNLALDFRSAEGRPERAGELARQVVALKPDVAVVLGGDMVPAIREATTTLPIVMLTSQDPVEAGVIASFARPGGNLTGVAFVSSETSAKRMQFLKEALPSTTRVAVLWHPGHVDGEYRTSEAAGRLLGIRVQSLEIGRPEDFDGAFQAAIRERSEALVVISSRFMNLNGARILEFASRQRIPVVSSWGAWVRGGGFMSYGPDLNVLVRRAATHVDKILKGARPGDLPVEQPTKFELVVNTKTAKALGLTIPQSLLGRADRVID